jgi:hypothetical protein
VNPRKPNVTSDSLTYRTSFLNRYTWSTSPLRRYIDLTVQRLLIKYILKGPLPRESEGLYKLNSGDLLKQLNFRTTSAARVFCFFFSFLLSKFFLICSLIGGKAGKSVVSQMHGAPTSQNV